jgi:hypothetical protein
MNGDIVFVFFFKTQVSFAMPIEIEIPKNKIFQTTNTKKSLTLKFIGRTPKVQTMS